MREATEASIFFPSEKQVPPKEFLFISGFLVERRFILLYGYLTSGTIKLYLDNYDYLHN